jgi:lysophospholipase L1-like esterase
MDRPLGPSFVPLAVAALALSILSGPVAAQSRAAQGEGDWLSAWSGVAYDFGGLARKFIPYGAGFSDRTVRNLVRPAIGGSALRIRLTNRYGDRPVEFHSVSVASAAAGAAIDAASLRPITFAGGPTVTIAPGGEAWSDAVRGRIDPGQKIAISFHIPGQSGKPTLSAIGAQLSYVSEPGAHGRAGEASAFGDGGDAWYFMDRLEVLPSARVQGTIVALGDSITAGVETTSGADKRYSDALARRLGASSGQGSFSVVNAGINGNGLLSDSPCFGKSMINRFEDHVLDQRGVKAVILIGGTNDLIQPGLPRDADFGPCQLDDAPTAETLIGGYRALIGKARRAGLRIYGATLPPFMGSGLVSAAIESERVKANEWIRTSGEFDGVFDFAALLQDPSNPSRLAQQFDSGDGLHPNDAAAAAMAAAIDPSLFSN